MLAYAAKTYRGTIEIGRNAVKKGEFLEGDLADILVFDRTFLTYDPIQAINNYFVAKWGVVVDGVLVRSQKNTHWKAPMNLIFDSETMGNWLGMPEYKDLPSTFLVDYVRVWKNAETNADWRIEFTLLNDPSKPTKILNMLGRCKSNESH